MRRNKKKRNERTLSSHLSEGREVDNVICVPSLSPTPAGRLHLVISPSGHGKKPCSWWCAACCGQYNVRAPNRMLVIQDSTDRREATVFRAHAPPH